jgi:hypothetical protein
MNHEDQGLKPDDESREINKNQHPNHNNQESENRTEPELPLAAEIRHWTSNIPFNERYTVAYCLKFKWAFAEKIQAQIKMLYGENRMPLAQQIKLDFEHVKSVIRDFDMHCDKRCYEDDEAEILECKRKRIETLGNNLADLIAGHCRLPLNRLTNREQERLKTEIQRTPPIKIVEIPAEKKAPAPIVPPKPPVEALTKTDSDILQAMSANPKANMLRVDIEAASGYGRYAVTQGIKRLESMQLVYKTEGAGRKGWTITEKGISLSTV